MMPSVPGSAQTAAAKGLVNCHSCGLLVRRAFPDGQRLHCPRCHARLHTRKPNSLSRTWALVIAAMIFYVPANLLPVTVTRYLGSTQADTIMSGVIYFMQTGSWGIAVIIFVASIVVPIAKLMVLSGLMISVQRRSSWRPRERAQLYRLIEAIGRWSMLDVFVVTVLVALVRLGYLSTIEAGPGVVYFAAVVVLTMIAAMTFDPRLIWDALEKK
ncbi:paraquat-inducible protein [Desulfosarcina ovata subsp. sediminis]|uniref:Paraquat-inducible protein n=1 Tax=Desulfosarcina ovata subsp. sediminis TaxID=885957 RepID=A0A5K7ZEX0_9BACT|nr:paraquat-inducible protein A [Desulfosarcina ovata]BBO80688.1 paraquat-inducible protein [Desulfosarcina ovata subsp. sediminis]